MEKILDIAGALKDCDYAVASFISIRHYSKTQLTEKYCIVVYREVNKQEGFVITAYFATKPVKWRRTLWNR